MSRYKAVVVAEGDIRTVRELMDQRGAKNLYFADKEHAVLFETGAQRVLRSVRSIVGVNDVEWVGD